MPSSSSSTPCSSSGRRRSSRPCSGWEIYQVCILACLLTCFPVLLEQFQPKDLEARPITVCVLGLLLAVVLSHLTAFRFDETAQLGWDFFKMVLYFLLFVGLVNTPVRLRWMLWWLLLFASVVALLAVLQYHGAITLPNLNPLKEQGEDKITGAAVVAVSPARQRHLPGSQRPRHLCS